MGKYTVAADPGVGSFCSLLRRGMDDYNKHFCKKHTKHKKDNIIHVEFYTNGGIVDAYGRYVATFMKRYAHEPSVLGTPLNYFVVVATLTPSQGWELANDSRCSSGLPASGSCTPQTITQWTATLAAVVKKHDPNHLVSVG